MFISLLCNGVGTALTIMAIDFMICRLFAPTLLFQYAEAAPWTIQMVLLFAAALALLKQAQSFHARAMTTPFSIAIAELKLKKEGNAAKSSP